MRLIPTLALALALTTHATAEGLLLYLDFEQAPPQDPYYLASEPAVSFSLDPLELDAVNRALTGGARDPDGVGFTFDPLELNLLARSLQFVPRAVDPRIAALDARTVSFTGRALDRSGDGRDTIAKGNVILLPESRSTAAHFAAGGRLQFFGTTWWDDSAPKSAMSVLAWVRVHEVTFFGPPEGRLEVVELDLGDGQGFFGVRGRVEEPFEAPVSLFPYVTDEGVLQWSLHSEGGSPIFTLGAPLAVGEWFHIAGTYDAVEGRAKLYINGEEVAAGHGDAELGVYAGSTGVVTLDPAGVLSSWALDDLNIWEGALNGDEVRSVMLSGPTLDNVTAVDEGDTVTTWGALKGR